MSLLKTLELAENFSHSEKVIAEYILKHEEEVLNMSTSELGKVTYSSPATIVRLSKKWNYKSYNDFKIALASQLQHQHVYEQNINPNYPFKNEDSMNTIAYNIANLQKEAIDQTMKLLNAKTLYKAVELLYQADVIDIYGVSGPLRMAMDFQYKMFRINRHVEIKSMINEQLFQAAQSNKDHCALVISYSGSTEEAIAAAKILKNSHTPLIGIMSPGENPLSKYCDYVLYLSPSERVYSKISTFASTMGIHLLLDILYAGIFAKDYDANLEFKIQTDRRIDHRHANIILYK